MCDESESIKVGTFSKQYIPRTLEEIEAKEAVDWLIQRIKQLEEGIRKHREFTRNTMAHRDYYEKDEILYKLLKE